jgi:hypothetical protein
MALRPCLLLLAAPLLGASLPPDPEDPKDIATTEERIGALRVQLLHYRRTGAPGFPAEWKKVRMIWGSGDGLGEVVVEDTGHYVTHSYRFQSADGKEICMRVGGLTQYGGRRASEPFIRAYVDFLRGCGSGAPRIHAHQAELRGAAVDLKAAGDRLRTLAVQAFGALHPRCIRYKPISVSDPMFRRCTRYSKPGKER